MTDKRQRLYGTASEHAVFYQYNFHSAANIYAGMVQTESPYYQPTPPPPAPFANVLGRFPGDPAYNCAAGDEFSGCDESWAIIMTGSKNIFVAGAGIYSVSSCRKHVEASNSVTFLVSILITSHLVVLDICTNLYRYSIVSKGIDAVEK